MIEVFVSSTFRDLEAERQQLLDRLDGALDGVGMEKFVPFGKSSQETAIDELKNSDAVIFLVSPYYGSFIEKCDVQDCKAECGVNEGTEKISYTHCEYKIAKAEDKPYLTYVVDKNWNIVNEFSKYGDEIWEKLREKNNFKELSNDEIKHYHKVAKRALDFKEEVGARLSPRIKEVDDVETISKNLAENIVSWYSEGKIDLMDFCGRRKELKEILDKMDDGVEVYGVGGIGKTTLIHVALLIQKLMGNKIITVGKMQSYVSGSGYLPFKKKCRNSQNEIVGERISLTDIFAALSVPVETIPEDTSEKIKAISELLVYDNIILFIDDFHLADDDVKKLIKVSGNIVLSSKKKIGISRNEVQLRGIEKEDRERLIDIISMRFGKKIDNNTKDTIMKLAEGCPASTELLVRNYEIINFPKIKSYKDGLDSSKEESVKELSYRTIGFLSDDTKSFITKLSLKNDDKFNYELIRNSSSNTSKKCLIELTDSDILKKKNGYESNYEFSFEYIKEILRSNV